MFGSYRTASAHTGSDTIRLQTVYSLRGYADFITAFFTSKMSYAVRYKRKCNFTYARKKSAAFPAPI